MVDLLIQNSTKKALEDLYGIIVESKDIVLSNTKKEFIGDITLVVFPYVKLAKKSPEVIANELGEYIIKDSNICKSFNVIKGFLNFVIDDSYWIDFLIKNRLNSNFGYQPIKGDKPIVIEYSSPNTNKPLHLGHIRNNLLGWSIAEILKANGYAVKKVNLVNDRGIHICKSMLAWMRYSNGETPETSGLKGDHLVGKYYVIFDKYYKQEIEALVKEGMDEEEAKKKAPIIIEAQNMLQRWENKDKEVMDLWKMMNSWVYDGFDYTYKSLGIDFDKIYYESETYLLGKDIVKKGLEDNILYQREDNSIWCDLRDENLDEKLLQRGDGTSVYMTQDLGTALLRHNDFDSDRLIYVVGNEQNYHFNVLKIVLKKLGFDFSDKLYHLSYGMVELPEGKMKSREGTVVDADDLVSEMISNAKRMTLEHGKEEQFDSHELEKLYKTLALGALKYFILKVDPSKNMIFNPKESIDFNGNTAPFIQYTYARIRSIIRKSEAEKGIILNTFDFDKGLILNDKEKEIIKILYQFPGIVQQSAQSYSPALIANFAYELAKSFNTFYQEMPILKEENKDLMLMRIALSSFVANVIKTSLNLLGINVPERM